MSAIQITEFVLAMLAGVITLVAAYLCRAMWLQIAQAKLLQAQMEKDHADLVKRVTAADPTNWAMPPDKP